MKLQLGLEINSQS